MYDLNSTIRTTDLCIVFISAFSHLSNLTYLGAGENNLTSIPEEIGTRAQS